MKTSICRGCGKDIVWVDAVDGDRIVRVPLDPRPPVYMLTGEASAVRDRQALVSHFATCPKANEFSGSKRSEG